MSGAGNVTGNVTGNQGRKPRYTSVYRWFSLCCDNSCVAFALNSPVNQSTGREVRLKDVPLASTDTTAHRGFNELTTSNKTPFPPFKNKILRDEKKNWRSAIPEPAF